MTAWEAIREAPRRFSAAVGTGRPALRGLASPPRRLASVPFAAVVVTVAVAGMIGLLLLTTYLQNQTFAVRDAQKKAAVLGYQVSDLESQVTRVQSPARLAARATQLGMVPNPNGVYIDLGSGRVVGEATRVRGDEIPSLQVQYPATASATAAPDAAPPVTPPDAAAAPAPDAAQPPAAPDAATDTPAPHPATVPAEAAADGVDGDPGAFAPPVEQSARSVADRVPAVVAAPRVVAP